MTAGMAIEPRKGATAAKSAWVVYMIGSGRFALPLMMVERVLSAVEITPLPQGQHRFAGVINVQGRVVPVVNGRERLGLPPRDLNVNDQLLMVRAGPRLVALLVDQVDDVVECGAQEIVSAADIAPGIHVQGALKLADGSIVLLEDGNNLLKGLDDHQLELPVLM